MADFSFSGGVGVIGFISPIDTNDTYAVIDPIYGIDGFRNVDSLSDLHLISAGRRRAGMVVGVGNGSNYYKLVAEPWSYDMTDWETFGVFATGATFIDNVLTITNNDNTQITTIIDDFSGLTVNGVITATTVSATTFYGDGSKLSGIVTDNFYTTGFTYSGNVFTIEKNGGVLPILTATIDTMTGLTVNGNLNVTGDTILNSLSAITITGNTFYGSGLGLTNIPIAGVTNLQSNLDNKFDKSGGTVTGSVLITGDITILGTATTINTETLTIKDNIITINSNYSGNTAPYLGTSGIEVLRGSATTATLLWDEPSQKWIAGVTGNTKQIIVSGDSLSLLTSGHTHPISEIINLQSSLDSKLDKTGGVISGNLTVTGTLTANTVSATNISGDGNGLTNIDISSINTLQTELDSKILKPNNPLLDDYLYYNGSTWVPKRIKIPVSSGPGYTLFLSTSASTLVGYELLSQIPTQSPEEIESATTNNNVVQIDQYATEVLGREVIDGGIWEYNSFAAVDIPSSGLTNILIGTYIITSGGVETLLFTAATTNITTTAVTLYNTSVVQPEYNCEVTDRLVVKYSASTNNNFNTVVYLYHGGVDNYSHIHTPFVTLHNDLAGLQGGSTDNYYHLELSQLNTLTLNNDASGLHNHYSTVLGLTGGTVNGLTTFNSGLHANIISATTLSATTLYGDGSNLFGVHDYYVTGATYDNNTFSFTNNSGVTFDVSFDTVTGLTVNGILSATTISGGTYYGDGSNLTGIVPPLSQGQIFIGDNTNNAAARNVIGDINIDYTGNTTIQPSVVTYAKIQNVSQIAVLGSSSVTGGTVEEIPMIEAYINSSGTTATLLTNTSNWDINGVYIGTAISGTTQGQSHYNVDYWFTAIDDNSWIRMIRG
jgi:hypothetical protein